MPTYQYRCRTCDARFEVRQSFSDESLTSCPSVASEQSPSACVAPGEGDVRKVFSAPSITFKGDGFYKTDSRSSSGRAANGAKGKEPSDQKTSDGEKSDDGAAKSSDQKSSDGEKSASGKGGAKESSGSGESKGERAPAGAASS